jgi:hypothetical protein
LRGVCGESGIGNSDPDFESFTLTNNGSELEKCMDVLRNRAMNYPKSPSVRAVTPALKTPNEFDDQTTPQKEERRPFGIEIERKDAGDYHKEWKGGLLSPSSDISEGDWNLLGSDDESIFPFCPDSYNDAANRKLVPNLLHGADNEHYGRIPSAKDAQPVFRSVSPPLLISISKDSQRWSNMLKPGEWMRGHQHETRLPTIPEVPQEQLEVEGGQAQ